MLHTITTVSITTTNQLAARCSHCHDVTYWHRWGICRGSDGAPCQPHLSQQRVRQTGAWQHHSHPILPQIWLSRGSPQPLGIIEDSTSYTATYGVAFPHPTRPKAFDDDIDTKKPCRSHPKRQKQFTKWWSPTGAHTASQQRRATNSGRRALAVLESPSSQRGVSSILRKPWQANSLPSPKRLHRLQHHWPARPAGQDVGHTPDNPHNFRLHQGNEGRIEEGEAGKEPFQQQSPCRDCDSSNDGQPTVPLSQTHMGEPCRPWQRLGKVTGGLSQGWQKITLPVLGQGQRWELWRRRHPGIGLQWPRAFLLATPAPWPWRTLKGASTTSPAWSPRRAPHWLNSWKPMSRSLHPTSHS